MKILADFYVPIRDIQKCRQLECVSIEKWTCTNGRHLGFAGSLMSRIPASEGVRLDFRVLQGMHEQTMFSQLVGPPRSFGMT